jgi:hypothetical protein
MTSLLRKVGLPLLLLAFAALVAVRPATVALAQQSSQPEAAAEETAAAEEDGSEASADDEPLPEDAYTEEELDDLVASVALYPDSLLAQVLVAATYPLDIVKAQRWADANRELPDDERTAATQEEGWDPSVAVLAAGFPTVLQKMAEEIDWTEQLGEAMLVQDGDVLDAVQRQRALAAAVGNLESNDAQTVEVQDDQITVAPANPEVVYVPVYDSQTVYTQPATSTTVVQESDDKYSSGELIATGVLAFGAGMIVNEVFRDDDPYYGYWGRPPPMGWGGGGFRPYPPGRGGVNIGGDVNINVDKDGQWRPDRRQQDRARKDIKKRNDKVGPNRKGSNRKVADRSAGGGQRDAKRPAQKSQTASLENRMKKRESGAAKTKPAAKKRENNAFKGAKGSGTASKKALDRGKSSSKKKVASKSSNRKAGSKPNRKADAGPKRKTGADKHKRSKNNAGVSRDKSRGKAKAQRGGGRRGRG